MNRKLRPICVMVSLAIICSVALAEWNLDWRTVDGGGAMRSTSASYELSGTIGQLDAGYSEGQSISLTGGFWFENAPGDCILDGAITLFDLTAFDECAAGPESPDVVPDCACMDFDGDGDVDLRDAAALQSAFSTP